MFDFFKRKQCEHDYEFVRNIYGDEINWCGGYRSEWRCKKCGKIFHMENQVADSFINEISESQGFNISKAETTLYGLCAQCK